MNKKEYEAKRAQLLAEMKAAIDAGDAVKASAAEKEVMELDEKFQALAKAQANFAALNGSQVPAAPAVPAALNTAPIAPVSNAKAEEDVYVVYVGHQHVNMSNYVSRLQEIYTSYKADNPESSAIPTSIISEPVNELLATQDGTLETISNKHQGYLCLRSEDACQLRHLEAEPHHRRHHSPEGQETGDEERR